MAFQILNKSTGKVQRSADTFDVTYDFDPEICASAIAQANGGAISQQSRMAQEIIEKDDDIRQAWGTRVAALSGLQWKIKGEANAAKAAEAMLRAIRPDDDSGLMSFWELLQSLQSAILHGFSLASIEWAPGGSSILGFRPYHQSWCTVDKNRDLPILSLDGGGELAPVGAGWIYHRVGDKAVSVCRVGLGRPLAWLFCFKRGGLLSYVRFLEKFGTPILKGKLAEISQMTDAAELEEGTGDGNTERKKLEEALAKLASDGWLVLPEGCEVDIAQPAYPAGNQFQDFLNFQSKKASRLILGQDSTSSAENSNRSTAAVHDLVRKDLLISDAMAVAETVTKILSRWSIMTYGRDLGLEFSFPITGPAEAEPAVKAQLLGAATAAGFTLSPEDASAYLGIPGLVAKPTPEPAAS